MLIFEKVPNENCTLLTEKKTKAEGKISPKILLEKNEVRENKKSEEKERRKRKKKAMAALLVFMLTSLEFLKEKGCLRRDFYFGCKVIIKSRSNIYKFFLPLWLIEI